MAACKSLLEYLEKKPAVLTADTVNAGCQGGAEAGSGVEAVGTPPGKRVRMKQCSFEVISKDGSRVLGVSAANKGSDGGNPELVEEALEKLEENDGKMETERKRKMPVRQCVESRRVQKNSCDLEEEERAAVGGDQSLKGKKRGRGKGKKVAASLTKQTDGVGVAIQSGKQRCTDCVGACNCSAYVQGFGNESPLGLAVACSMDNLGKAGSDFFSPISKKRILKQLKLKSEIPDAGGRNPGNAEAAPENISKRRKQAKESNIEKGHSPQNVSSKQGPSKRKFQLMENSRQLDALNDGNGAKLSNITFNLRLEAKQAAKEIARLSAGRETHPFFTQQKSLQTRVANVFQGQFEVNPQNLRLPEMAVAPCPPFHITQNDQVEVPALDWKGWEFVESKYWNQDDPNVLKETFLSIPEEGRKLLKSGVYSCFSKANKDSSVAERGFSNQDVQYLDKPSKHSRGIDRNEQIQKLFAYLENRSKVGGPTVSADQTKHSWNKLSVKDLEQRFTSYYFRRSSGMNNLWTDKYQPETSDEVCGNFEQVMLLNDWLRCWHDKERSNEDDISIRDEDWGCFQNEDETLSKDGEDGLRNILLLTGPIGSGKSAALYACAKEQGFDVIEVNASECRNGALVKQKFGEAMESHGLNQRAIEEIAEMGDNKIELEKSFNAKETREKGNARSKAKKEKHKAAVSSSVKHETSSERGKHISGMDERRWSHSRSKALILFEDVDTIFDEDRGFMGALLQIAETAKRPIVLTSNRRDPSLPRLMDRITIQLELPSVEELVCHVFMVCIAEGIIISPNLVEHVVRCCCRDLRKTLMLLQFWFQGKNNSGKDVQLSYKDNSVPLELDAKHRMMPKMMPWSFPCKLSETINISILEALDEEKEQEWFNEAKLAEEHAARENIASQLKNKQRKMNQLEKKAAMLKRNSCADDSMQIFRDLENEMDEISKVTLSLGQRVKHRRRAVVTSDSEDADFEDTDPAISETQLQDPHKQFQVEMASESDDMTFSDRDGPISSQNWRGSRQGRGLSTAVFRRLKKIQDEGLPETSSLMTVSCVQESALVPETLVNCENLSHVQTLDSGNTSGNIENSVLNTCSPLEVIAELQNTECLNKTQEILPNLEGNILKSVDLVGRSEHYCEEDTETFVGNNNLTTSQTTGSSSKASLLKCKENSDDNKLDSVCIGNEVIKISVKHLDSNTVDRFNDRKYIAAAYEMVPLMDECSRVDFNIGNCDQTKPGCMGIENPVQQMWLKMLSSRENFKPLLDVGSKNALPAMDLATKLTDLISSGDLLISSYGPDHSDVSNPLRSSRDFNLYGDYLPVSCSDECMEITSTLVQQGLSMIGHSLDNASNLNLEKEILIASTNSMAVGKLILAERDGGMVCSDEFSEIGLPATERYSISQARQIRLSDALESLVPTKSFFMAKGVAFHEYTSFLGRISKLEEARLLSATTLKRRARGCHHYLSTGHNSLSSENILLLSQHSSFQKMLGR